MAILLFYHISLKKASDFAYLCKKSGRIVLIRPQCIQSPPCRRLCNKTRFEQVGIRLRTSCSLATAVAGGLQSLRRDVIP